MATFPLWVFLPTSWDIGNVRAILALIINSLCVLGIWVVAYSGWKVGAMRLAQSRKASTSLLSLFSPAGLGDVLGVVPLLRISMGFKLLAQLLIPGAIIAILSAVAIASAPIARYSTRVGVQVQQTLVPGTLSSVFHSSLLGAVVKWNTTIERFNSAGLPLDQLVDFLPDNTVDWKYTESEWNSSWSASCQWTERTAIELYAMGNASATGRIWDEIQGLDAVFPSEVFGRGYARSYVAPGPFRGDLFPDKMLFVLAQTHPNVSYNATTEDYSNFLPFHLTVAAFHLKNTPANFTSDGDVTWGTGPIEGSWYTMARCNLERTASRTPDKLDAYAEEHIAHPWTWDYISTVEAFGDYYRAPLTEQSFRGEPIYHPSGAELFRLYQAYLATKDIQDYEAAARAISVAVPAVELSVPVLVVFLAHLAAIGLAAFWFVVVRRLPPGAAVPRTKVEWMAQGMRESSGREVDMAYLGASWGELWADFREAKLVTVRDPSRRSYNTIQLGLREEERGVVDC